MPSHHLRGSNLQASTGHTPGNEIKSARTPKYLNRIPNRHEGPRHKGIVKPHNVENVGNNKKEEVRVSDVVHGFHIGGADTHVWKWSEMGLITHGIAITRKRWNEDGTKDEIFRICELCPRAEGKSISAHHVLMASSISCAMLLLRRHASMAWDLSHGGPWTANMFEVSVSRRRLSGPPVWAISSEHLAGEGGMFVKKSCDLNGVRDVVCWERS